MLATIIGRLVRLLPQPDTESPVHAQRPSCQQNNHEDFPKQQTLQHPVPIPAIPAISDQAVFLNAWVHNDADVSVSDQATLVKNFLPKELAEFILCGLSEVSALLQPPLSVGCY